VKWCRRWGGEGGRKYGKERDTRKGWGGEEIGLGRGGGRGVWNQRSRGSWGRGRKEQKERDLIEGRGRSR